MIDSKLISILLLLFPGILAYTIYELFHHNSKIKKDVQLIIFSSTSLGIVSFILSALILKLIDLLRLYYYSMNPLKFYELFFFQKKMSFLETIFMGTPSLSFLEFIIACFVGVSLGCLFSNNHVREKFYIKATEKNLTYKTHNQNVFDDMFKTEIGDLKLLKNRFVQINYKDKKSQLVGFVKYFSYDYSTNLIELFLVDVEFIPDLDESEDKDDNLDELKNKKEPKKMEMKVLYFNENIKDILITFLLNEEEEI